MYSGHYLLNACQVGDLEVIKYLIENEGVNINFTKTLKENKIDYDEGHPPLFLALKNYKYDVVKYLLEKGADIETKNNYSFTPLMEASYHSDIDMLDFLLTETKADINGTNDESDTALINAAKNENACMIRYLVEKGADINKKNYFGHPALTYAIHNAEVRYISGKREDIKNCKNYEKKMLKYIIENDEIVKYLIEHGANEY